MWQKKSKLFLVLSVLFSLLCFSPLCSICYADVTLTYEETEQILNEIQLAKTESENVKKELEDVKNTYNEQKTSYEDQLNVAEKKNQNLKTAVAVTSTASVLSIVFAVLLLIF